MKIKKWFSSLGSKGLYCRIHEGVKDQTIAGHLLHYPCDLDGECGIVGGFLELGTRLKGIQTLTKLLCKALAEDRDEVVPGMDCLQAAETIRVASENLIADGFDEDECRELEEKRYPNKGLWLLELAGLLGEGAPQLVVKWPADDPSSGKPAAVPPA